MGLYGEAVPGLEWGRSPFLKWEEVIPKAKRKVREICIDLSSSRWLEAEGGVQSLPRNTEAFRELLGRVSPHLEGDELSNEIRNRTGVGNSWSVLCMEGSDQVLCSPTSTLNFHEEKFTASVEGRILAGIPPPFFTLRNLFFFCLPNVPFGQWPHFMGTRTC